MIDHLGVLLENYPGPANRTRCFTHILNLIAKCIMKQFDTPKKNKAGEEGGNADEIEDKDADDLAAALDELEDELENEDGGDWEYDMRADMTNEDVEKLEENVKPVRGVLSKVS
jgi:archaellum component FlaC